MARIEFSANPTHLPRHPRPPPPSDRDETQNSSVDYISELPVAIILHIFSFLTTKDAIKTSVLSKQWRSIWTANPHISFSMPSCDNRTMFRTSMAIVDAVLLRCTAIKVKSFLFYAPHLYSFIESSHNGWLRSVVRPTIDRWLRFAVEHDIEEVSMTLRNNNIYAMPQFFFHCTTLVSFHVSRCSFSTMGAVNWFSLKRLRIDDAKLEDNVIMRVLKGCPVLEFFELKGCWGFEHIKIESRGLRELVIDSPKFVHDQDSVLKISAPHLLKLRILGNSVKGNFKVEKVSSLIEAELNFIKTYEISQVQAHCDLVNGLLQSMHHVTKLVMGSWCFQVLSLTEAKGLFLPSLECLHLMFPVAVDHEGAPVIAKILESSPRLEKLILQMTCTPSFPVNDC
ncbi:hypothetical protein BT93_C2444 [Corymbia citriodora subsp. variegata]|nr:hypothetical protein BT93_C2444 [Corymbia citriodora subsp. variegata]